MIATHNPRPFDTDILIANPNGFTADEHPYIGLLSQDLVDAGIAPVALRVP